MENNNLYSLEIELHKLGFKEISYSENLIIHKNEETDTYVVIKKKHRMGHLFIWEACVGSTSENKFGTSCYEINDVINQINYGFEEYKRNDKIDNLLDDEI